MKKFLIGLLLVVIIIPLVYIGGIPFKLLVGVISVLGYKEIIDLKKKKGYPAIVQILGLVSMILMIFLNTGEYALVMGISYNTLSVLVLSLMIPVIFYNNSDRYNINDAFFLLGFIILLGMALNMAINIRIFGVWYFIYLLIITISTDTFGQIFGRFFGNKKLTKISPKKTWAGSIGGTIFATIIATLFYFLVIGVNSNIFVLALVSCLLSIIAQFGDLSFSAIKRSHNIKDFSNIIPGHGGVLDRIDSIVFVIIAFSIIIRYL